MRASCVGTFISGGEKSESESESERGWVSDLNEN